jgi:lysyl-tRNA synthetase class 1
MSEEYPVHWLEPYYKQIMARNPDVVNLSTGKTPSGHIHLGILREIIICDALRRIFEKQGKKVNFRIFFDSLDAAKRFPDYITQRSKILTKEHLGKPFAHIPDPYGTGAKSYAHLFAQELLDALVHFGVKIEPVFADDLYKTQEMYQAIKIGLDNSDKVRDIISRYNPLEDNWRPAMAICEKCGRTQQKIATKVCTKCNAIQKEKDAKTCSACGNDKLKQDSAILPNRVLNYDKSTGMCYYECPSCNYKGSVRYDSGYIKLNWRLDWPSKWYIYRTTCEPAGKDHCTKNGSYDTGLALSRELYGYEGPVPLPYEWVRLGDNDMSTSQGIVFTPNEFLTMAPPEIFRMVILTTHNLKHIAFRVEELESYMEEYNRMERIYYGVEKDVPKEIAEEIKYIFPLIQPDETKSLPDPIPENCPDHLPFKLIESFAQLTTIISMKDLYQKALKYISDNKLKVNIAESEFEIMIKRMQKWLLKMQELIKDEKDPAKKKILESKVNLFTISESINQELLKKLTTQDKEIIKRFVENLEKIPENKWNNESFKDMMMDLQKQMNIKPNVMFKPLYLILVGSEKGPRLGPLMELIDRSWLISRLKHSLN